MNFTFSRVVLTTLFLASPVAVWCQSAVEKVRAATEHAHLVGHEDELLLKRIDDAIAEWDPRNLASPYLKTVTTANGRKYALRRPDLTEFIADPDAAVALGKAFFWDMQAGSDFKPSTGTGTACASCHYRFGADARNKNTEAIAYPAWEKFVSDRNIKTPTPDVRSELPAFSQRSLSAPVNETITRDKFSVAQVDPSRLTAPPAPGLLQHEIVGSQGMPYRRYTGVVAGMETFSEVLTNGPYSQRRDMFISGGKRTRQVTQRNSPSTINAVFNDRQFHDGRAESTFNGISIFADYDKRVILKKAFLDQNGKTVRYEPVSVAIANASLASQAVGPIVNEVEMSYVGRNFHDIAARLLSAQPLAVQTVNGSDSALDRYTSTTAGVTKGLFSPEDRAKPISYRELIQRAFRKEWWADDQNISSQTALTSRLAPLRARVTDLNKVLPDTDLDGTVKSAVNAVLTDAKALQAMRTVAAIRGAIATATPSASVTALLNAAEDWNDVESEILPLRVDAVIDRTAVDAALAATHSGGPNGQTAQDDLMVNNFSLYWGLAIMLYESTLISNGSPFDQMIRGDASGVDAVFNGTMGQRMIDVILDGSNNTATPGEPSTDDIIRRVQLDKLTTKNDLLVLTGGAMFQRGFRVFMQSCAECHPPPFFTSAANLELAPELPEPIAKLHAHSLIRTSLADAFKSRLLEESQQPGTGVTDANRNLLGKRRFFFDQERIPEVEATVLNLMVELMDIPDKRPVSFNQRTPPSGVPLDRDPMITWANWITGGGTRPPLGFAPSPKPGGKPVDPYAFYDLGFYNLGVAEPRYDWGVWGFVGAEEELTSARAIQAMNELRLLKSGSLVPMLNRKPNSALKAANFDAANMAQLGVTLEGLQATMNRLDTATVGADATMELNGIPSLGSAYRLPRARRIRTSTSALTISDGVVKNFLLMAQKSSDAVQKDRKPADHTAERNYLALTPSNSTGPAGERADIHFFKRARRMVMTEENWGHRKAFISDNELMGWGAFKTPSLRNVALTEPYMHNGRFLTLRQVLQFYSFDNTRLIPAHVELNPDLHPEMGRLFLNSDGLVTGQPTARINLSQIQDAESLLFFLHCLTDDRVRREQAPFDHPSISLVNGFSGNDPANELRFDVPAVGSDGTATPPSQFPAAD